jgi:hypothetical protein
LWLIWLEQSSRQQLLDALDHFLHQVERTSEWQAVFYGADTPEQMVALAVEFGILINAEDFRALLRSGSSAYWVACQASRNPITHLQKVFGL